MALFLLPFFSISSRRRTTAGRVVKLWDTRVQAGLSDSFSLILFSKTSPGVKDLRQISLNFHFKLWQGGVCKPGKEISIPTVPIHFIITCVLFKTLKKLIFVLAAQCLEESSRKKVKLFCRHKSMSFPLLHPIFPLIFCSFSLQSLRFLFSFYYSTKYSCTELFLPCPSQISESRK